MLTNVEQILLFINGKYNRFRYLALNILQELWICRDYLMKYRIFLINCKKKYSDLFNVIDVMHRVHVNDAYVENGQLKSPTVNVIYFIKYTVRRVIESEDDLVKYVNDVYANLQVIIKGLEHYKYIYTTYLKSLH